ncbi:beta-ketoacyl-[acyl-carrier-protein] synthase family protein [bacterium]|nr:beta-ketoacyl-[acyl-carrier-protein] synthase family protein [bacterium]
MSSNSNKRQVVVTGIGLISPLGNGRQEFYESIKSGRSGVGKIDSETQHVAKYGIGAEVKDFDEKTLKKNFFKEKEQKKSIKVMCREIQMGAAGALMALEDSQLDLDSFDHTRMGIDFGANLMYYPPETLAGACKACVDGTGEFNSNLWGDLGLKEMEPLWMLKYLPNMPACHIGIFTDSRGPNNSVTLDEASPGVALTEALNILERGSAEVMIVGGTGTRLHSMRTLQSRLWDDVGFDETNPSASCKPFDKNRNGQAIAEAAGSLILEEEEHAKARGATIYGKLLAGGSSCVVDTNGVGDSTRSVVNSMNAALKRAGISVSDLGHINSHGIGTVADDAAEAKAYQELLGGASIPVAALKGATGNAGAGNGFLELTASLLSVADGVIPPAIHTKSFDEDLGFDLVVDQPRATSNKIFANVNFAKVGQSSVAIFEAP